MSSTLPYRYIAIEGNIGAGKTTFCNKLSEELNCQLILEEFDDNPFLPFFYKEPDRYAFTVELFFMTERYKQMQKYLLHQDLFLSFTLSDYFFTKTLLFARMNLPEEEFRLFQKMFNVLNQSFPGPDILVYFHRSVDYLTKSINKRGRSYESYIKPEYLLKIQNAYFDYFRNILSYPVVIIDLHDIDFINEESHYAELKNIISKPYKPGVHRVSLLV